MVKHIIIWNFKEEYTEEQKTLHSQKIKAGLENLAGKIDGLIDIKVHISPLSSSNGDLMLDSTFASEEALLGYQKCPDHLSVATFVRSVVEARKCFDFEI